MKPVLRRVLRDRSANCRLLVFLLASLVAVPALAGPMVHHIEYVLPRGGQRGTTVEVTLQGVYLKDPREIVFFRPGIRAIDVEPLPPLPPQVLVHGGKLEEQVRCRFVIDPDCPLGEHPFKLRTATELTLLSTFWVTPFPVVKEVEGGQGGNDLATKAQTVAPNVTVHGKMDSTRFADVDFYRVPGKAGEHLSVEVDSVRLTQLFYADSEFDLMVRLLDADGRELARNDDSALHLQDPIVSTILPRDGEYLVELRQRIYKSAAHNYYLAHIGTNRRPLAAYPAGGPAGQPLEVTLLGDPAGPVRQSIVLPATTGDFAFSDGAPSAVPMRVSEYANVLEHVERDETSVPQLPAALNGIIETPGDVDAFRLTVRKGDRYRVRVFARALGTPLDPRLWIQAAGAETPEVEADDATHADRDLLGVPTSFHMKDLLDPSFVWEPKQDGEYVLSLTDMRSLGDPLSVYRIEVEPVRDAVHTILYAPVIDSAECPRLTGLVIPQGNRWTLNVSLGEAQGNQYKGELEIVARGLPAGVTMIAPRVPAGYRQFPVQFIAAPETPQQTALITLEARAVDESRTLLTGSHQAFPFLSHSGGRAWHPVIVDRYALAVTQPAPFTIELVQPDIPLSQNGELAVQARVTRHGDFDEPIDFQFDWTPSGVTAQPTLTIPAGETEATLRLIASSAAQPGVWKVAVTASTTGGSYYLGAGRVRVSSSFIDLTISEPYVALKCKPSSVRRGERARVVWEVEHKKPFEGEAEAVLLGLPKGVTVVEPRPRLRAGDALLVFEIEATGEALLGQYKELTCEIVVRRGQEIRQRTGKGVLRVDPAMAGSPATSSK